MNVPGSIAGAKFKLDKAAVGQFAKTDPGLIAAVDKLAEQIRREVKLPRGERPAFIAHYTTDRHVAGIVVKAIHQAKHGALTKAAGIVGAGSVTQHD
jgi:hypothetical protein